MTRQVVEVSWCGCGSHDTRMSIGCEYAAGKKNTAAATNGISCLKVTPAIIARAGRPGGKRPAVIWLPFLDTYRTMCCAPEPAFRRILENIRVLGFAV